MATPNVGITSSRGCAAGIATVGNKLAVTTGRAPFNYPAGLALAPNGDCIVANSFGHSICRQAPNGMINTIAGAGWPRILVSKVGSGIQQAWPSGVMDICTCQTSSTIALTESWFRAD